MMRTTLPTARIWALLLAIGACLMPLSGMCANAVANGNFEINHGTGAAGFNGWTAVAQTGSNVDGGFLAQTGPFGPLTHFAVATPPEGSFAAMSDQNGPGSYILYQDIVLPAGSHPMLSAQIYVQNEAQDFYAPATLDYTSIPNQQARFDLVNPAAAPTDLGAGVLQTFYASQSGDPLTSGYTAINADLSAYAGSTVRLRFAEVDNQEGLLFGIDAVSVQFDTSLATSTALTGVNNPSVYSQPVTFTATVTGQAPTGSITFADGGIPIACGSTSLSAVDATHSRASCTTSALNAGTHGITAVYSGDATNLTSTSPAYSQVVNMAATTTTVQPTVAVNPGQSAQINADVAIVAPGAATLSGMVTIVDTTDSLSCSYSLPATSCSITPGSSGTKALTATFAPDSSIATNVSGSAGTGQLVVTSTTAALAVASSLNPSTYGQSIVFTATVTGQAPTGSVSFADGSTVLCAAATLNGAGQATCTTSALVAGTHTINGHYSGDINNVVADGSVAQMVNPAASSTSVVAAPSSAPLGLTIVFTATVTAVSPTGSVTFAEGGTTLSTVALSGGTASFSTSNLAIGAHTITASYSGDANNLPSSGMITVYITAPIVATPMMSPWTLIMLCAALALAGLNHQRTRKRRTGAGSTV